MKRISTDSIIGEAIKDSTYCDLSVEIGKWARDKQLESCEKELNAVVRKIFEDIEKSTVLTACIRDDVLEQRHKDWQALKQKYLGGK